MRPSALTDFLQLGKFRLCLLVLFTTSVGYGLAAQQFDPLAFSALLIGTMLSAMGANGLNQVWEYKRDAKMARTRLRPIPAGRLSLATSLIVTLSWTCFGIALLYFLVNPLTAVLGALTCAIYLLCYTPLKPYTSLAVLVGAIPGAIPPVMGWTAATNELSAQAWVLGCILFLWQIPHFMSLASIYRTDYASGGYRLLPDNPQENYATRAIIVVFSIALLGISLLTPLIGLGAIPYFAGAIIGGIGMSYLALVLFQHYSLQNARRLFIASILYLPLVMTLLLVDQIVITHWL